jgi:hypothetical protein
LFEAASSSITSIDEPLVMARQLSQTLSGSPSAVRCSQFRALARMRAVDVLPVPRGPVNR